MKQIAIYGKGGIGKSTIACNLSETLAGMGRRVLQVGCDPKRDSSRLLLRGAEQNTVLGLLKDRPASAIALDEVLKRSPGGVDCIEAGGPEPGVGCAGRGILSMAQVLESAGLDKAAYDLVLYDVLGDVVCGGFAVPMRDGYADEIYVVTSGEIMSLYAANNICKGLKNLAGAKLAGIIGNGRGTDREEDLVRAFARAVGSDLTAFFARDPLFKEAEARGRTVAACAPDSDAARKFRLLAEGILRFRARDRVQPAALSEQEFEAFLSGFFQGCAGPPSPAAPEAPAAAGEPARNGHRGRARAQKWERTLRPAGPRSRAVENGEDLYSCALAGAFSVSNQVRDAWTLMHSPSGCAHTSLSGAALSALSQARRQRPESAPRLSCTDLREQEMVFGGEGRLRDSILRAAEGRPSAIFVITSCPSAVIGDDPKRVLERLRRESKLEVPVVPIASDGILGGDYAQGMLNAYQDITDSLVDPALSPEPGWVNVVAEPAVSDSAAHFAFFRELLDAFGLRLNCRYIQQARLEDIRRFRRAQVNLLAGRDRSAEALRRLLEERTGAHFFPDPAPCGWDATCRWLRRLEDALFRSQEKAERWIETCAERRRSWSERLKRRLAGKKAAVFAYAGQWDWLWEVLRELEIEVLETSFYENTMNGDGVGHEVAERRQAILDLQPDLVLANYALRDVPPGVIAGTLPFYPAPGFFGALEVAERWAASGRAQAGEGWREDLGG